MQTGKQSSRPTPSGYETVMEGADMRALVLTLAQGENLPWHYHSGTTDLFVCLTGRLVVETRAPSAKNILDPGQRCAVPPMTAHYVRGEDDGPCSFLILQGVGVYDRIAVGG
jgi:quercetin dioxygenase-like cupin family protein